MTSLPEIEVQEITMYEYAVACAQACNREDEHFESPMQTHQSENLAPQQA